MRRQQTYGKRSRALYKPLPFSSPDQTTSKPTRSETAGGTTEKPPRDSDKLQRKALGERSHNAVVQPLELIPHVEGRSKTSKKPKPAQRTKGEDDNCRRPQVDIESQATPDETEAFMKHRVEPEIKRQNCTRKRKGDDSKHGQLQLDSSNQAQTTDRALMDEAPPIPTPISVEIPSLGQKTEATPKRTRSKRSSESRRRKSPDKSQKSKETDMEKQDVYETHCRPLLDFSYHPLTCFKSWSAQISEHFDVSKIAEASFGEVYRLSLREQDPDLASAGVSVYKIIPLHPPESLLPKDKRKRAAALKKAEFQSKPQDVATEVQLLLRMNNIPGFTNFRDIRLLQGRPGDAFIEAFQTWNADQKAKQKDQSHWPDPSRKSSYSPTQLWAVIEMQDAGTDLERLVENGECSSIWTVWDTFWQVVLSLGKGEEGAEFEHRDLHLGNICIRSSPSLPSEIDPKRKIHFTNLETTIIDYTISRCLMPDATTAYTNLSLDNALFEGDSSEEYQYEIYRYMRSVLFLDEARADFYSREKDVEESGRDWEQFHPQTNLVWLHLVLEKLLAQVAWPSEMKVPNKKTKKEEYRRWKRANDLEHAILRTKEVLDPDMICQNGLRSASDLVRFAWQEEWLGDEDINGHCMADDSVLVSQLDALEL